MDNMYGRIENLCQKKGMTVGKLCSLLNISRGTMGDLKAGRTRNLSASNVSKIAKHFSVSTDYLLGTPQDGADMGIVLSMIQDEYGISYDEATKIWQTFTPEWREEKNAHGIYDCFRIYFAENGIYAKEKAPTLQGERALSDDDIKFALFGGGDDITDAMYEEVRNFAAYIKQREAEKKERP